MRVLIFHGYLLQGTGSNVYNANLAAALVRLGHEVHLLCQDRSPEELPFVDAVGDWDGGTLAVRTLREPARCTVYRPALAGLLPVYVADRYAGVEARPYPDCSEAEVEAYVEANVRAVRDVVARARPDVALANHLVMGPLVLARALGNEVPYAVKIHGSALEYTVAPHPERFLPAAREGIARAQGILVGSGHIAERLVATLDDEALRMRIRLGPPGVDVARFVPRPPADARAGVRALAGRLAGTAAAEAGAPVVDPEERSAFARDAGAAAVALEDVAAGTDDRLVAFVGKLIVSKGIDLLLAAWPLVVQREPRARLVVVGFGAYRAGCERLIAALADGDLATLDALVEAGRAEEGGPHAPLALLRAFLDGLDDAARANYLAAAADLRERVVLTGRLDHEELIDLLPACEALVVPSTFPEAFGMVAAEGAACGALPVCAEHSGLAEVASALAQSVPEPARPWLAFPTATGSDPVRGIAERVTAWLAAPDELREQTRSALVETVRERWSWEGVARGVIAAAGASADAPTTSAETPPQ
ncbi:MAG TPA: glycosyltransferase family 4 protein [Conexibacter sp.]|jgi:glycosyltransferase involved in cell wall biosynthesis|nr:glycosyltransferase family 4 protein [Conexibacter sp.]